jgi:predicted ATPase
MARRAAPHRAAWAGLPSSRPYGLPVPPPVALGDPGLERARLFETIAELVQRAAARAPVVLAVEDVHWADAGSLDVLQYLGRSIARSRCLLLLTYRPDEAGPGLRRMLESLRRGGWLTEVELPALDAAAVAALVAGLLDDDPPDRPPRRWRGAGPAVATRPGPRGGAVARGAV